MLSKWLKRSANVQVFCGSFAFAPAFSESVAVPPPPTPSVFDDTNPSKDFNIGVKLGRFPIKFETTTLTEVQKVAAAERIDRQGDAGEAILWLCYSVRQGPIGEAIWLISSAEMGGSAHSITDVVLEKMDENDPSAKCPQLPPNFSAITIGSGVRLGSSLKEILKTLGKPTRISSDWYVYTYQGKVPDTCQPGGLDRIKWLIARFADGLLVEIHTGQTTSC